MASISPPTTRGPQNPGKYPRTGPTYAYYGEQPGFVYNPWTDRYVVDPNAQREYEEQQGIREKEPKQPSAGNQLATTIGGLAAGTVAVGLTKAGVDRVLADSPKVDPNASGGLIPKPNIVGVERVGGAGPTAATPQTAPTPGAAPVQAGASGGLMSTPPVGGATGIPGAPAPSSPSVVGTGPAPGSTLMRDGSIVFADGTVQMPDGVKVDPNAGTAVKADGTPIESTNIGPYIQGALGVLQLISAAQQWKGGDKVGAGMSAVAGGTSLAAAGGSTTAASALPVVGAVTGLYTGYKTAEYLSDAPSGGQRNSTGTIQGASAGAGIGAAAGSIVPGVGTTIGAAVGAVVGAVAGFAGSYFGSKKGGDQMIRDKVRDYLQENKIIDERYQGTLADGSKFDFGKDGKGLTKLDFEKDPMAGSAAGLGNVIAAGEGLTGKAREATAYLYAGAMKSNAADQNGLIANFKHFAAQRGFTPDAVQNQLNEQFANKKITKDELDTFSFELQRTLGAPKVAVGAPPIAAQPGPAPLQPGQTPQSTAAAAGSGQPYQPVNTSGAADGAVATGQLPAGNIVPYGQSNGLLPPRTGTSPGFDKNGRRINYGKS